MYSIPQQAVTKGYWKIEYLRAQPRASSSRLVKNPASLDILTPIISHWRRGIHPRRELTLILALGDSWPRARMAAGARHFSLPIQGAVVPGVEEPDHQDPQEDDGLDQARDTKPTI